MPLLIEEEDQGAGPETSFRFHHLPEVSYNSFGNPSIQPLLEKWGFGQEMGMLTFRVEQHVGPDSMQAMLEGFFRDRGVLGVLHSLTGVRVASTDKVKVHWGQMGTGVVSMSFLNKFEEAGAIGKSGHIKGRIEEDFEGVAINNLIREVILCEESELYDAFTEKERKEFLFRIFSHLVFGGASNQYEDHVEDYFKVTKEVYKDLLTVRRNDAGDVEVLSTVASIRSLGEGGTLFPKESPLNFFYIIHDPLMRHVRCWYFCYKPIW